MRKTSLKKKTGCLRCKRRHKRCDELKPKCSYCARWQLDCVWPEVVSPSLESKTRVATPSQTPKATDIVDSKVDPSQHVQHTSLTNIDDSPTFGLPPLHVLSLQNYGTSSAGSKWVREFLLANTSVNNICNVTDLHAEIVHGWPEFEFLDKRACAAHFASWAESSVQRRENSVGTPIGSEFETLTISRLRRAINPRAPVSEEMLLAVAVFFFISDSGFLVASQLRNTIKGMNVMVRSFGGIDAIMQKMRASTVLAVLHCDIFGSLLNAEQHFFVQLEKPKRPQTLTGAYHPQCDDNDISRYIAADVIEVFEELRLLLYLQQPLNQSQTLPGCETHRVLLNQWIDYRLGVLQAFYVNERSLSQLFIIALIILKQEIITDIQQHPFLVSTLLTRLQTSTSHFQTRPFESEPESELVQTITMWTSLVALTGTPLTLQRFWFADYIHHSLSHRHGPVGDWPDSWDKDLRLELQRFPWHEKIAARYAALCSEIRGHRQAR